jgi:peptidoglycan-associated lipoprotein
MSRILKVAVVASALSLLAACSGDDKELNASAGQQTQTGTDGSQAGNGTAGSVRPGSLADFQQNIGDRVFFDLDQHTLSYEGQETLAKQADWIKQYSPNSQIVVEGHCDERGTREYNIALGARRAVSARNFLVSKGLNAGNIKAVSFGKERPAVEGSDEGAWAQNRRAVTAIQGLN